MRTRRDVFSSKLGFEQLEGRRLLAADFAVSAMADVDSVEPTCHMVSADFPVEDVQMDLAEENAMDPAADLAAELSSSVTSDAGETLTAVESEANSDSAESTAASADATAEAIETQQLELSDGMDGFFGSLTADSPMESMEFTTPADGMVSIVMASSFDEGQLLMAITDSNGDMVETDSSNDDAFTILTFEASENESYQLTVETKEVGPEGQFQVTVGFDEFVDQHADEVGSDSTKLEWVEGQIDLTGKLEAPGDVDTFRFNSDAKGEVMLQLNELEEGDRVDLDVQVFDAAGNVIADGATNEMLQISFDVMQGEQYFVSVTAGENQKGDYSIGMEFESENGVASELVTSDPTNTSADSEPANDDSSAADDMSASDETSTTDETAAIVDDSDLEESNESGEPVAEVVEEPVVDDIGKSEVDDAAEAVTVDTEEPTIVDDTGESIVDDAGEPVVDDILETVVDELGESTPDEPISNSTDEEIDPELVENDPVVAEISEDAFADCEEPPVDASEELIVDDEEITVDSGETEPEVTIEEPTVPVDETIGEPEAELPIEAEITEEELVDTGEELVDADEELVDESDSLIDDGSLITGEPESPIESEEMDPESDPELTDSSELELVDNVESDSNQDAEEPVVCFAGIETVDEFFAELGSLASDSSLDSQPEFGPFNIFGSNLNFWARGTAAGNQQV